MQYSPKLKIAMEEIKAILKKHDIAGHVVLHEPGFGEFLFQLSPSWSAVTFNGDEIRLRAKVADYGGDKVKHRQVLDDSVNMLNTLSKLVGEGALNLLSLTDIVNQKLDVEQRDGGTTSHTTQNN